MGYLNMAKSRVIIILLQLETSDLLKELNLNKNMISFHNQDSYVFKKINPSKTPFCFAQESKTLDLKALAIFKGLIVLSPAALLKEV